MTIVDVALVAFALLTLGLLCCLSIDVHRRGWR